MMATNALSVENTRDIESFVSEWVRDEGVPGVSVAIVDDTDCLYTDGFGARNLETNAPASPNELVACCP